MASHILAAVLLLNFLLTAGGILGGIRVWFWLQDRIWAMNRRHLELSGRWYGDCWFGANGQHAEKYLPVK